MINQIKEDPEDKLKNVENAVLVFFASWCGDCLRSLNYEKKLARDFEGKISFYRMDAEEYEKIADKYGVENYPTFVFFKKDKSQKEILVEPSSEDEIRKWISSFEKRKSRKSLLKQ